VASSVYHAPCRITPPDWTREELTHAKWGECSTKLEDLRAECPWGPDIFDALDAMEDAFRELVID
jgi:hypothetical protein